MAAQMSFGEFEHSIECDSGPPSSLSTPLQALWLDAKGDWDGAHLLAQKSDDVDRGPGAGRAAAWVHAYLHRKEGDEGNAAYWYAKAGRPMASGDLNAERRKIAEALLKTALPD